MDNTWIKSVGKAVEAASSLPGADLVIEVLGERALDEVRRNRSRVLRTAVRLSGLLREDLEEALREHPELQPIVVRVLHEASMTQNRDTLMALSLALSDAIRRPEEIDRIEMLLHSLAPLRRTHVRVLHALDTQPLAPAPDEPKLESDGTLRLVEATAWGQQAVAQVVGITADIAGQCLEVLAGTGLVERQSLYGGGTGWVLTTQGRLLLEVLESVRDLDQEPEWIDRDDGPDA